MKVEVLPERAEKKPTCTDCFERKAKVAVGVGNDHGQCVARLCVTCARRAHSQLGVLIR